MIARSSLRVASLALGLVLAACGGGGGGGSGSGLVSTPPPPPLPPPFGPPNGALVGAVQTTSIISPTANGPTPNFSVLGQATDFPLLQTAIDSTFGGDQATTQAGAILRANVDGTYALTINNPAVGIGGVPATQFPGAGVGLYNIATSVIADDLDFTRFGHWMRFQATEGLLNAGVFAGGFVSPTAAIPTTGTASYSGTATGLYNEGAACNCGNQFVSTFTGNVALHANFAQANVTGAITGITLNSLGLTPGAINDIGFNATLDRQNNFFAGSVFATTFPTSSWAFSGSASGTIDGRFYGPGEQEAGAVFSLSEGAKRLVGSFGVKCC